MKLRERTEAELQTYRTKLTQIEAAIERDVQMHHDNVHVYGLSGRSMDSVILAHYKLKGATEGAIRILELMLEEKFEDD